MNCRHLAGGAGSGGGAWEMMLFPAKSSHNHLFVIVIIIGLYDITSWFGILCFNDTIEVILSDRYTTGASPSEILRICFAV